VTFDVAVIGGGPAGLAIAATLQRRGHRVVVLERAAYDAPRVGESFGGEVGPLLRALGAWDAMAEVLGAQVPRFVVRSAWGSSELVERSAMQFPHGHGWHVDRARFDGELARWAASIGVEVRTRTGTCTVVRDGGIRVVPRHGEPVSARFLVDACGRGRSHGERRWLACDRQIAMIARLPGSGQELLVESVEEGWWYSAPQPDGSLVVALVSDGDLRPSFAAALARTIHTAARVSSIDGPVRTVRADSGRSVPDWGRDWCAAGDAAIARDPLAGDGVSHALRDALELVDPIDRVLAGGEARSDRDPPFRNYLDRRDAYYAIETRWPDAPFWRRRHAGEWRDAPVTLHPETVLARGASSDRAAAEALLPPRAIAAALAAVPAPAHAIMTTLRAIAPVGDRRLLVGLQRLVACDVLQ
jgi:2-polyprenyl-6-methoxyphenol hydroxylase-like FAD-dependent oxidoreductase